MVKTLKASLPPTLVCMALTFATCLIAKRGMSFEIFFKLFTATGASTEVILEELKRVLDAKK